MKIKISESDNGLTVKLEVEVYDANALLHCEHPVFVPRNLDTEDEFCDQWMAAVGNSMPTLLRQARLSIYQNLAEMVVYSFGKSSVKPPNEKS